MAKKSINIRAGYDLAFFSKETQNLAREMRKSGKKMQSIGKSLSMSLTAPITILGGLAVKTFATFEQSMAKVQAISGATGKEFENLTNLAKQLGITTRFSASEVSDLMLNYSKLGFSSEEIDKITASTLNLALATGEDLAESATMAGGMLRAYKIDAQDVSKVTDTMALAFSSSSLDLEKFKVSMPKVAAVSNALGFSFQRTTAMISTLVSGTHEASTSGTMLRNMMLKAKKEGFSFDGAIQAIANSSTKAEKAMEFFNERSVGVAITLAENIDLTNQLTKEYMSSGGTAKAMADIMDNTLEGAMKRLNSATEGLAIEFGEIMAPAIGKVADLFASFALMVSKLPKPVKTVITVVAGLTAVIGPLIFAIGGLKIAFATITKSTLIIAAKIIALIAVIAGIALVYQYIRDNSEAFATYFKNLWVRIVNSAIDSIKGIAKGLSWLAGKFGVDIGIDAFFDQFKLKKVKAEKEFESFGDTVKKVKETVSEFTLQGVDEEETDAKTGGVKTGKRKSTAIAIQPPPQKNIQNVTSQISEMANKAIEPVKIKIEPLSNQELGIVTQAQRIGEKMGEALSSGLQNLVKQGAVQLGEFLGDALTGDADAKDFGKGLLSSIGGFMKSFGEAMIAIGIAESAIAKSIALGPAGAGLAIAGGIALIAAGAALSNLSKKGIDTGGGGTAPMAAPMGGGMGAMNTQPIALETKISGRDLILVQNREKGFTR